MNLGRTRCEQALNIVVAVPQHISQKKKKKKKCFFFSCYIIAIREIVKALCPTFASWVTLFSFFFFFFSFNSTFFFFFKFTPSFGRGNWGKKNKLGFRSQFLNFFFFFFFFSLSHSHILSVFSFSHFFIHAQGKGEHLHNQKKNQKKTRIHIR